MSEPTVKVRRLTNLEMMAAVLRSYAPPAEAEQIDLEVAASLRECGEDMTVKILAGIIYEGLAYGNWPWEED